MNLPAKTINQHSIKLAGVAFGGGGGFPVSRTVSIPLSSLAGKRETPVAAACLKQGNESAAVFVSAVTQQVADSYAVLRDIYI